MPPIFFLSNIVNTKAPIFVCYEFIWKIVDLRGDYIF